MWKSKGRSFQSTPMSSSGRSMWSGRKSSGKDASSFSSSIASPRGGSAGGSPTVSGDPKPRFKLDSLTINSDSHNRSVASRTTVSKSNRRGRSRRGNNSNSSNNFCNVYSLCCCSFCPQNCVVYLMLLGALAVLFFQIPTLKTVLNPHDQARVVMPKLRSLQD